KYAFQKQEQAFLDVIHSFFEMIDRSNSIQGIFLDIVPFKPYVKNLLGFKKHQVDLLLSVTVLYEDEETQRLVGQVRNCPDYEAVVKACRDDALMIFDKINVF
ncbi:MAG: hypothetical protein AAGI66_09070, partial [Cyanobacteria bacterium P01_H01_bin.74]